MAGVGHRVRPERRAASPPPARTASVRVWDAATPQARRRTARATPTASRPWPGARTAACSSPPGGTRRPGCGGRRSADPLMLLNSHADQVHDPGVQPGRQVPGVAPTRTSTSTCGRTRPRAKVGPRPPRAQRRDPLPGVQPGRDEARQRRGRPRGPRVGRARRQAARRAEPEGPARDRGRPRATSCGWRAPAARRSGCGTWTPATRSPPTGLCPAYSVAASPDGKWLAVGGTDHFTQLWDAAAGRPRRVAGSDQAADRVADVLAPTRQPLAHTSPADGLVWLWKCDDRRARN